MSPEGSCLGRPAGWAGTACLAVCLAVSAPGPAPAQSNQSGGSYSDSPAQTEPEGAGRQRPIGLTKANTHGITTELAQINETCGPRIEPRYRIDCLRQSYLDLARSMPDSGDYLPVRNALIAAAAKLDLIVVRNIDTAAPAIRPHDRGRPNAPELAPVRAVRPSRVAAADAAAAEVVRETGLLILRSGRDPKRRTAHYTEIAAAVDDNLIVLRSG